MGKLVSKIQKTLPSTIIIPEEILIFFDWIEKNGELIELEDGLLIGSPPGDYDECTLIEISPEEDSSEWWCFDSELAKSSNLSERIYIFARTGADGSCAAFWLDDDGKQKIVHIGSGSGSAMMCVLADEPIDFLRLLAIGYEEICWNDEYTNPPDNANEMNQDFKEWVISQFGVSIPLKASDIVPNPTEMWDLESTDPFCKWISKLNKDECE